MAVTCKYCKYQDERGFRFCPKCGKANISSQADEHPEVINEKESHNNDPRYPWEDNGDEVIIDEHPEAISEKESQYDDPRYPWEDNGDEVVVDETIPPYALGQAFETYFYQPGAGYGYLIFEKKGIGLKFPKGRAGSYGGGYFHHLDFDSDGDFDADDLGCLAVILVAVGIGWVIKKLAKTIDGQKIKWSTHIPKEEIQSIALEGRTITFSHPAKKANIVLRVAKSDGERLYRELYHHFPSSVSRWFFEIRELIGDRASQLPKTDVF